MSKFFDNTLNSSIIYYQANSTKSLNKDLFSLTTSYIAFIIIALALMGNTTCFIIFRFNKKMKSLSSMVILSFVCITDTFSLFTWNLNHYLTPNYGISIEKLNKFNCKFFTFLQYSSLESSGLLLSLVCIDRYFTIISKPGSFVNKLPFGTSEKAFKLSCLVVLFTCLINSYLLIYDRNEILTKIPNKIDCYKLPNGFRIGQIWESVHLAIYTIIPFCLMIIFNLLLLKKIYDLNKSSEQYVNRDKLKIRKLCETTVSLLVISICFLIMTLPAAIAFVYFPQFFKSTPFLNNILTLIDYWSFLNHSSLFFSCYITNLKFRYIISRIIKIVFNKIIKIF